VEVSKRTNRWKMGDYMKRILTIILLLIVLLQAVGCSSQQTSNVIDEGQAERRVDPANIKEELVPKYIAPLTGLPTNEKVESRIVGVMINNHPKARPQSGLDQADIVYEVLAEGLITRFVAIYQSNSPDIIGPVRSIRPYYLDIINGFDALIAHVGQSNDALAILQHSSLPDLDEITRAGEAYWRVDFRKMPHNAYTNIEKIRKAADSRKFRAEGYIPSLLFQDEQVEIEGLPAQRISISYSDNYKVGYQYNPSTKLYDRSINEKPHTDLETKKQLTARNILVIQASHKVLDSEGRREVDVYGPGNGYLIQNGVVREIEWQRKDGVIRPFINGKEQAFYPGQTWVQIIPSKNNVSIQ